MHAFAATFWTFDVPFIVFRKSKDYFKWLLAIFAVELIARHGDLRKNARAAGLLIYGVRSKIAGVKASSYLEGGQFPASTLYVQVARTLCFAEFVYQRDTLLTGLFRVGCFRPQWICASEMSDQEQGGGNKACTPVCRLSARRYGRLHWMRSRTGFVDPAPLSLLAGFTDMLDIRDPEIGVFTPSGLIFLLLLVLFAHLRTCYGDLVSEMLGEIDALAADAIALLVLTGDGVLAGFIAFLQAAGDG